MEGVHRRGAVHGPRIDSPRGAGGCRLEAEVSENGEYGTGGPEAGDFRQLTRIWAAMPLWLWGVPSSSRSVQNSP